MAYGMLKTGIDLIEIGRLEKVIVRHGEKFLNRIFTPLELKECGGAISSLAVRFAAKEAVAKALGTGIGHVSWREIEIQRKETGEPQLKLYGEAEKLALGLNLNTWSISLSHTRTIAIAQVIAIT